VEEWIARGALVGLTAQFAEILFAQRLDHDRLEAERGADQARGLERAHEGAGVEGDRVEARRDVAAALARFLAAAPRERFVRSVGEASFRVGDALAVADQDQARHRRNLAR
jgi:hypothetical protein